MSGFGIAALAVATAMSLSGIGVTARADDSVPTAAAAAAAAAPSAPTPATASTASSVSASTSAPSSASSTSSTVITLPTASAASAANAAPPIYATTRQPRSFGYVLGDVLTQRVLLEQDGHAVQAGALPVADRVGMFVERRTPRIERDELGRAWLAIDYQVINAPRSLFATSLPALSVGTTAAGPLNVAAWPISIGPLTPPVASGQGGLLPLRPDRAVEQTSTAGIERDLRASLVALTAVLLAWAAWWAWRNWREAQRLPFARAWSQMRRLDPDNPEAWLALHHALNASAGRALHGGMLPRLFANAPHLRPLQARLEDFFQRSSDRFFVDASAPASVTPYRLHELGRALREAERRHRT